MGAATLTATGAGLPATGQEELVVLLTPDGQPRGTARKAEVHQASTPYHLAFSCYVFDGRGRLLVTRRAASKVTWPGVWTNSCCGHPGPGEAVADAVQRRLDFELGLAPRELVLALPDFSYRASLHGVEEHELCPVFLARVDSDPLPEPSEVGEVAWCEFAEFAERAARPGSDLSPWARLQAERLAPHVEAFLAR
jgi:isopentenyl-diphosphate delta-isomerase